MTHWPIHIRFDSIITRYIGIYCDFFIAKIGLIHLTGITYSIQSTADAIPRSDLEAYMMTNTDWNWNSAVRVVYAHYEYMMRRLSQQNFEKWMRTSSKIMRNLWSYKLFGIIAIWLVDVYSESSLAKPNGLLESRSNSTKWRHREARSLCHVVYEFEENSFLVVYFMRVDWAGWLLLIRLTLSYRRYYY